MESRPSAVFPRALGYNGAGSLCCVANVDCLSSLLTPISNRLSGKTWKHSDYWEKISSVVFQRGDAAHICCQASPRDGGPPATARNAAYNRPSSVSAAAQARGKSRTRFSSVECGILYLCKNSLISSKQYFFPRKLS